MEWVETTAKTVELAKELALDQLHVDEDDAEFEVVESPRPGLFGRTRGEARVRARVRPVQPRPKVDRRERRRPARKGRSGGDAPARRGPDEGESAAGGSGAKPSRRSGGSDEQPAGAPRSRSGARGRGRGGPSSGGRDTEQSAESNARTNEEPTVDDDVTVEEQAEIIQGFVEGLVDAFGYPASVTTASIDDETMEVQVHGDDLGLLVGSRGATLQAIHDLSRSVVQRQASGTHHGRVRLDVAGYRERRREALERFTQKLVQQALDSGVAQVLEPMSASDRKVVHDTANDIEGVHTVSEGEDARRHVVIVPDQD